MNQTNFSARPLGLNPARLHMATPWGLCVYLTSRNPEGSVITVGTESHGGIGVLHAALQMPEHLASPAIQTDEWLWFEEDCAWCCAAIAFPEMFPGTEEDAKATMCHWLPDIYAKQYGVMPTARQSMVVREREVKERLRNNFRILRLYQRGAYPEMGIPESFAYVCGYRDSDGSSASFLVPEALCVSPLDEIVLDGFQRWSPGQTSNEPTIADPSL